MRSTPLTRAEAQASGKAQAEAMKAQGQPYSSKALDTSAYFIPADVWACVRGFEQAWGRP